MKEIRSVEDIRAPPERVWEVLTDFQKYSEWNQFIYKVSGKAVQGEKLEIWIRTPAGKERHYEPTIVKVNNGRELRWLGKSFFLDGEHIFTLEKLDGEITRLTQREIFKGLLTHFFNNTTDKDIAAGFETMNLALKRRAESS